MEPSLFPGIEQASPDQRDEVEALIALSMVPGVGPGRIRALVARFGSASAALTAPRAALSQVSGIGAVTADAIAGFQAHDAAVQQLEQADQVGARLITAWDPAFPPLLRQIYDPPAFIWMRGEWTEADERAIAIVGTRRPSDYGRRMAADFTTALVEQGFTIVSGLAYGIDGDVHRAALEAGGRTIGVLGSGVDRIYPASHTNLAQQIIPHGAVISEYAMGAAPDAVNFPRRNRVVSGLSLGTLIVEAYEDGGALITARLALEQNREVFAVPHPANSPSGAGVNRLIQQGQAKLVMAVEDILTELGLEQDRIANAPALAQLEADLNEIERQLYQALDTTPVHIDTLCLKTGLDTSTALVYLLSLEFKGLVRQMAGKQFFRA